MRPIQKLTSLLVALLFPGAISSFAQSEADPGPLEITPPTPGPDAAGEFETLDGFRMTLLAAEPLVTDPVAICYDEDGRAYVAEMNDYPYTDKAKHWPMQENPTDEAIGKIRLLTDENDDGVFDKSTVFAEGLSWPTGVVPWKGGVFVTAPPDFWYFKDTDGDGVADVRKVIASGFRKYNVQSGANTPVWGLDNRITIATGRNKGEFRFEPDDTGGGVAMSIPSGRDVRIDPGIPRLFEFVSGGVQFGNAFDDWGNRFLCSAGNSVHHVVIPAGAIARNPWLPSRATVRSCLDPEDPVKLFPITEIESWRLRRYQDRKFVPRPGYTESRGVNPGDPSRPTSSCGHAIYRGDAYPESERGRFFVAESCYHLVYRLEAHRQGATFRLTKPASDRKSDFIASRDVWFSPIAMVNAPDGCLHLLDFYRESIEHPWSLPESFHERMNLLRGRDRGRIYRIEPEGYQHRPLVKMGGLDSAELVSFLEHPNAWHRETAQRLLFERQDKTVFPALEAMVMSGSHELGRLHALWTLDGLGVLHADMIVKVLNDRSPGARASAAKMAAGMGIDYAKLLTELNARTEDPDPLVRFYAALAVRANATAGVDDSAASNALATVIRKDVADPWARLAVLSSAVPHAATLLETLLSDDEFVAKAESGAFLGSLAQIVGAKNRHDDVSALISRLADRGETPDRLTLIVVSGLADGLRNNKSSLREATSATTGGSAFVARLIERSRAIATDPEAAVSRRTEAVRLLRVAPLEKVGPDLKNLLQPEVPEAVQSSAASTLGIVGARHPETGDWLLEGWDGYSGEMRSQVLQLLLAREERLGALLDAVESGEIQPYQLGPTRRESLLAHKNSEIAARAGELFGLAGSRDEVLTQYKAALSLKGDPATGEAVYQAACMACHKFREKGLIDLAPNLAVVSEWEPERMLTNILDPNREVAPEYMEYLIETKFDDTFSGRVLSESPDGITLKLADNSTRDISRSDIQKLKNTGRSLMPDGLEAAISVEAMADLIAFLQTNS